ncbi:hypothetical protein Trydic_g4583 [Trypoxylus dichotomus]
MTPNVKLIPSFNSDDESTVVGKNRESWRRQQTSTIHNFAKWHHLRCGCWRRIRYTEAKEELPEQRRVNSLQDEDILRRYILRASKTAKGTSLGSTRNGESVDYLIALNSFNTAHTSPESRKAVVGDKIY